MGLFGGSLTSFGGAGRKVGMGLPEPDALLPLQLWLM